jgi:uncharacterized membrane protein
MVNLKKVLIEVVAWVVTMLYFWFVVLPQFALSLWGEVACLAVISVVFGLIFVWGGEWTVG